MRILRMCIDFNMFLLLIMKKWRLITNQIIMIPIVLSVIARAVVESQNCFGGVETFEKTTVTEFDQNVAVLGTLLHQENAALTRDCVNLCKQQSRCLAFRLNYADFRCSAYADNSKRNRDRLKHSVNTNYFEKICLKGISRQVFDGACGHERLWSFERVKSAFIEGFVEKQIDSVGNREECAKSCLMETSFICRSADYDDVRRICRMSKEDRRTQWQAFRQVNGSSRDYLENQCAAPGPSSCVYRTKPDFSVLSMDSLHFAQSSDDCQMQCDREVSFNCRAFSYLNNRCILSGDDGISLVDTTLPSQKGAVYGERTCVAELCTNGIFTYEKMTGHVLRSAVTAAVELPDIGTLGVTGWCRESCDAANLNCPAFSVNYQGNRCEKLDRNSQGRTGDLIPREGESYFEKICLRVPQIMTQCQDKYWAFERILGHELAPILYIKTLNFVQSRRDCEEYCLQEREFPCRSALYNDETTECRLSQEDRRTSPASYYRSRSIKVNYLENQCVRSHSTCPYEKTLDAYPTYTDLVETNGVSSHEVCETYCNDNKRFLCRSFAYYSANGQCFISGDDRGSAGSAAIQKRSGIIYFERQCSNLPTSGTTSQVTSSQSVSPSESPTPSATQPTTGSTGSSSNDHLTNGTSLGPAGSPITRFPGSLIPTLPPKGNGFSAQFEPFAQPSQPLPPQTSRPSFSGQPLKGSEIPQLRALETDLNNVHSLGNRPSQPSKCGPNARYLFEKVTSFEPIGGHLTLLYSDLQNPGIVTECARRCEHSTQCRAFVVDYYHQSCHGLFENSSVGNLDLRLSMGKDYFEGFCVPNHIECNKFWPFDRIIDQASIGVMPQDKIRFISRGECRKRCLEERKYKCLSSSYDSALHECRLYTEDRNSGSLTLLFTKGTDYMENQCAIETFSCRYHPIERDISIVSVTKSVRGTSTFHCEQACDHEKEFNCRSYTYLDSPDGSNAPGGNLCLLSSDNRATSHQGSMQFRPRALYAEKDCVNMNQRSRVPATPLLQPPIQPLVPNLPNIGSPFLVNPTPSPQPMHDSPHNIIPHIPAHCSPNEYTFEKTFGYDLRYARRERAPIPPRLGVMIHCQDECLRRADRCKAFVVEYGQLQSCFFLDESAGENRNQLNKVVDTTYVEKICLREKRCEKMWTFERIIGHNLEESADKEIPSVLLRTDCQDLCLAEKSFTCRSATFDYSKRLCKLFGETRRSRPHSFKATNEFIDYFENQCVTEPSTCQYKDFQDSFFPYIDRITNSFSLADCQRQCDAERLFPCRSINYETFARDCALSSEDMVTLGMGPNSVVPRRHSLFSEKGNCEQVSVQCNQQDMVLTLNFDSPFNGRVYAKGSPSQCFVVGTGQTQLQFAISLGNRCGTRQEGANNFANEVIVQQHAVIMTDSDRTIRVLCSFETSDQTVTLMNGNQNVGKPAGIDVTSLQNARTRLEHPITSIVTNTAPPPAVMMRILDRSGNDAQLVGLGDELVLRIELKDPSSAFALFARNLYARSSNGESLFLIDNMGCPTDAAIFPALQVDMRDRRSLFSTFKAFRFPTTGVVNFEVQIRFCQEKCEAVKCMSGTESLGKRRKRQTNENNEEDSDVEEYINETETLRQDDSLHPILIPNDEAILAVRKRTKGLRINKINNKNTTNSIVNQRNRSALMEEQHNYSSTSEPLPKPQKHTAQQSPQDSNLRHSSQYTVTEFTEKKSDITKSPFNLNNPLVRPTIRPTVPSYSQSYNFDQRSHYNNNDENRMHESYGTDSPSLAAQPHLAAPTQPTTRMPTHISYPSEYYQRNDWNNNYGNNYKQHNYPNPHFNTGYNPIPMNQNYHQMNNNRSAYWQPYPYPHPYPSQLMRPHSYSTPEPITAYPVRTHLEPHYLNPNDAYYPHESSPTTPKTTKKTRPPLHPSYLEWGDSRPARPPPRPSPRTKIIASTEKPQTQEIPLSLTLMVGDQKDSNINSNDNNWKQNTNKIIKKHESAIHSEECDDCNLGLAVFYTALTVSLIHMGLVCGAYFYITKLKSLRSKFANNPTFDSEDDITRISHPNSTSNQSLNDNVFYGSRELGYRSSHPPISTVFDSSIP